MTTTQARDTQRIATAYDVLAQRPGAPVDLLRIYHMVDMTRAQFHAALLALLDTGRILLEPEPKLRRLTAEDHAIAVRAGGEDRHTLSILP